METLLATLDRCIDDEEGHIAIESASWDDADVSLTLRLRVVEGEREGAPVTWWAVTCRHVLEHRIVLGRAYSYFLRTHAHPLLWPHVERGASLFVASAASRPLEVVARLHDAHEKATGRWLPPDRFLNTEVSIESILTSGYGLLARAPDPLVKAYVRVLEDEGVAWSAVIDMGPPKRWEHSHGWIEPAPEDRVAVLGLDDSYVVARRFVASACAQPPGPP